MPTHRDLPPLADGTCRWVTTVDGVQIPLAHEPVGVTRVCIRCGRQTRKDPARG